MIVDIERFYDKMLNMYYTSLFMYVIVMSLLVIVNISQSVYYVIVVSNIINITSLLIIRQFNNNFGLLNITLKVFVLVTIIVIAKLIYIHLC